MADFTTLVKNINWFYFSLLVFAVAFPFSESLISISIGLILITSLFGLKKDKFMGRLKKNGFLLISGIYLIYLVGFIFCKDLNWGLYDLRKSLAYLIIPVAFALGEILSEKQLKRLLIVFVVAVVLSSLITLFEYLGTGTKTMLSLQESGYIHHIRFGLQINFAIIILTIFYFFEFRRIASLGKIFYLLVIFYLILYLILNQSFTGLVVFCSIVLVEVLMFIKHLHKPLLKKGAIFFLAIIFIAPIGYLYVSVKKFYKVENVDFEKLEKFTPYGNIYTHPIEDKQIENGNYVWLYICEEELKQEWDKRNTGIGLNDLGENGYPIKATLIRYLTSKGLRKDAEGVKALTEEDIANVKKGISNYILAKKRFSIYPRVYISIWELDRYFRTGNANHQSLSQRIEYTKAAIHIIKENFLFGVGTGNWKEAYKEAYIKIGSKMNPERYGDAHNQYLNYWVKFGVIGLAIILFFIIYPVIKTKRYKNPIILLFLVSMFVSNFGDSNFETHVGGTFFVFFYCLLLSSEEWVPGFKKKLA